MTVVTFGEIMLRLSPPGYQRFVQASTFDATFGGGEANVAASLAQWGVDARFVSRLPVHEIGDAALGHLRRHAVDTRHIVRGGDRVGIYFLEIGASQRASKVIYDRAHSAIADIKPGMVDWEAAFEGADWFHWTGITPALGEGPRAVVEEACRIARQKNMRVSADLNYRAKLWSVAEARRVMRPLMEYVDVCIANEEDADKSLGLRAAAADVEGGQISEASYTALAEQLREAFGFEAVAITLRESHSATHNGWSAVAFGADMAHAQRTRTYDIPFIVDRVGGGDAFAAGFIFGLLRGQDPLAAASFAAAASCLKHSVPGDFNHVSISEVEKLASGAGSGRVER